MMAKRLVIFTKSRIETTTKKFRSSLLLKCLMASFHLCMIALASRSTQVNTMKERNSSKLLTSHLHKRKLKTMLLSKTGGRSSSRVYAFQRVN